jgi:hypothetical protein
MVGEYASVYIAGLELPGPQALLKIGSGNRMHPVRHRNDYLDIRHWLDITFDCCKSFFIGLPKQKVSYWLKAVSVSYPRETASRGETLPAFPKD